MNKSEGSIAIFNNCAKQYQDKYMEMDLYNNSLDLFCSSIKKENATILEVGCGPGNITKYLLKKCPGFQITAIDLSENMISLAKANNPSANFLLMDCRDISNLKKTYDAVLSGFCLPYLSKSEAIKFIKDASGLLNEDGVLYISTMEDDYNKSGYQSSAATGHENFYTYFHEGEYLAKALLENRFSIIEMKRQDYPEQDGKMTIDLIIIARKF